MRLQEPPNRRADVNDLIFRKFSIRRQVDARGSESLGDREALTGPIHWQRVSRVKERPRLDVLAGQVVDQRIAQLWSN